MTEKGVMSKGYIEDDCGKLLPCNAGGSSVSIFTSYALKL